MIKKLIVGFIVLTLIGTGIYAWMAFPIISGYGAKDLCSCVFVGNRNAEEIIENQLSNYPLKLGSFAIHYEDSSATGSVFGFATKKAVFRKGLGCTLISKISENEVRNQNFETGHIQKPDSIKALPFPHGDQIDYKEVKGVQYEKISNTLDWAFENLPPNEIRNTRGVVILYKDSIIGERYAQDFDASTPQIGWSMTKSLTATLIGILEKEGKIDLYKKAPLELWKEKETQITTDQLMRMSSGLYWNEDYGGPSTATNMLFKEANMGNFAADQDQEFEPDAHWYYSSGTTNILSQVARDVLKENYHQYWYTSFFHPIGMYETVVEPDASGTIVGSSYCYATPRDWARFGLLYLKNGNWYGKTIVDSSFTQYVATPTRNDPSQNYGGQFWLNKGHLEDSNNRPYPDAPTDIYSANGYDGQRVFIVPSKQLVVVRLGLSKRKHFDFNKFISEIVNAVD